MKRILILSTIAALGFSACSKNDSQPSIKNVKYQVTCTACQVTYTNEYGFPKTADVNGQWSITTANFGVSTAKIKLTETSPSNILSSISVNGRELAKKSGAIEYEVKVK